MKNNITTLSTLSITLKNSVTGTVIEFEQVTVGTHKAYTLRCGDKAISYNTAAEFNAVYNKYRKAGWKKPEEMTSSTSKKESKKKAPRQYPEGFKWDSEQYYRIAQENKWTFCDPRGRIHVYAKKRDAIYELMAAENLAK